MSHSQLDQVIWGAAGIIDLSLGSIAIYMWIKKLHHELPIFFSYLIYEALRVPCLYLVGRSGAHHAYFVSYWTTDVVEAGLGLAVIYEVFHNVLRPYSAIQRLSTLLFSWAAVMALGISLLSAFERTQGEAIVVAVIMLERSITVVQAGLLLFLFGFARSLGVTWRSYVLGIAVGLSLTVGADLAAATLKLRSPQTTDLLYRVIKPIAYDCGVLVWVFYFLQPRPVPMPEIPKQATELSRWNEALTEVLYNQ